MPDLWEEHAEAFARDGFVNVGRLFDDAELAELRSELERIIDATFRGKGELAKKPPLALDTSQTPDRHLYQLAGLATLSEPYRRVVEHPRLLSAAAALAKTDLLQLWCDQSMYKPPLAGGPVSWHQDGPYVQAVAPHLMITAWVALDDSDEESGCLWMVPGSHLWGVQEGHLWKFLELEEEESFSRLERPEGVPAGDFRPPEPRPVGAGEVHFHHCLTWHASPPNRSNRPRRAVRLQLMPRGSLYAGGDGRIAIPVGTPMTEAGPEFPVLYRR